MTNIAAFRFDTPDGAGQMLKLVQRLTVGQSTRVEDAAVVTWVPGERKPRTRHVGDLTGADALGGSFWGLLFGQIFFVPFLGMAVAAAMGALAGKFSTYGIDRRFTKSVSEQVVEGTSALFLITSKTVLDRLSSAARQKGWTFEIISTHLTPEQERELRQDFAVAYIERSTGPQAAHLAEEERDEDKIRNSVTPYVGAGTDCASSGADRVGHVLQVISPTERRIQP